jgi:hypothetical protein
MPTERQNSTGYPRQWARTESRGFDDRSFQAAEGPRLKVNDESATAREVTFGALIDRFIIEEFLRELKDRNRTVGLVEEDEEDGEFVPVDD